MQELKIQDKRISMELVEKIAKNQFFLSDSSKRYIKQ